jgi:hypothetical protein
LREPKTLSTTGVEVPLNGLELVSKDTTGETFRKLETSGSIYVKIEGSRPADSSQMRTFRTA